MSALSPPPLAEPGDEHLHGAVGSDAEEARAHTLRVLFEDRAQADAAVAALRERLPVAPDSISVTPAPELTAPVVDDSFGRDARGSKRTAARWALVATPVGVLVGLFAELGIPVALAVVLLGAGFAGFGALSGALVGLARADSLDDDAQVLVTAGDEAVLVTVRHLRPARLRRLLVAAGGVPVDLPSEARDQRGQAP